MLSWPLCSIAAIEPVYIGVIGETCTIPACGTNTSTLRCFDLPCTPTPTPDMFAIATALRQAAHPEADTDTDAAAARKYPKVSEC